MTAQQLQPSHKRPHRTCVACRRGAQKRALLRFVRDAQGYVSLDMSGRKAGRGAYVCADRTCFDKACRNRAFDRALRVTMRDEDIRRLDCEFSDAIKPMMVEE